MILYYISIFRGIRVYTPLSINSIPQYYLKEDGLDKYYLINRIFGDHLSPEYVYVYQKIFDAIKYSSPDDWDEAAEMLIGIEGIHPSWISHFTTVAHKIRLRNTVGKHRRDRSAYLAVPDNLYYSAKERFRRAMKGY